MFIIVVRLDILYSIYKDDLGIFIKNKGINNVYLLDVNIIAIHKLRTEKVILPQIVYIPYETIDVDPLKSCQIPFSS